MERQHEQKSFEIAQSRRQRRASTLAAELAKSKSEQEAIAQQLKEANQEADAERKKVDTLTDQVSVLNEVTEECDALRATVATLTHEAVKTGAELSDEKSRNALLTQELAKHEEPPETMFSLEAKRLAVANKVEFMGSANWKASS